ncbi:MAG TPA: arylesterase [Candidatus Thioglobus sp.]|jgi:acyl-CoA thioesterase-1|nr:arylesterase [Candidatus Thioglobus sp.]
MIISKNKGLQSLFCLFLLFIISLNTLAAKQITIMLYGDSLMAGYGLNQNENLSSALAAKFSLKETAVLIINASVSGNTTSNGLARLDWSLGESPNIVILCLGANDMLRGIDPKYIKENLNTMISKINESGSKVILAGMRSPKSMGGIYQQRFDQMYREIAEEHDLTFMPFLLEGIALEKKYLQNDYKHPNALGIQVMANNLYPYILESMNLL